MPVRVNRSTGGSAWFGSEVLPARSQLTVGECLLEFVVGDHAAPVFVNPTKPRPDQLGIQSARRANMASPERAPCRSFLPQSWNSPSQGPSSWLCRGGRHPERPALIPALHLPKSTLRLREHAQSLLQRPCSGFLLRPPSACPKSTRTSFSSHSSFSHSSTEARP